MSGRRLVAVVGCGCVLLTLTGAGIAVQQRHDTNAFVIIASLQGAVYVLAIGLLRRCAPTGATISIILGLALAMRVPVMMAPPALSSDVYRYIWDGRVISAGINPYRYVPADPHLAALRDAAIFPNINRSGYARTIYPPGAEAIFYAITRFGSGVTPMKAAMVAFEAVAVVILLRLLALSGQPPTRIAIYAWHPLPLWEFAGSGHIDAAIVALVALALWSRRHGGRWCSGLALAAGTLVKLYPCAILPALWRRWDWRLPLAFAGAVALAYLPFLGVGWRVFGFLPNYVPEEGFSGGGSGFYLWNIAKAALPLAGVPEAVYPAIAAALLAAAASFVALRRRDPAGDVFGATVLAGAFMLLLSPHYPWYFAWLLVLACLTPSPALVWLTLASFLLYLVPVWPHLVWDRRWFLVDTALYLPFIALATAEIRQWHKREQATHGERALR